MTPEELKTLIEGDPAAMAAASAGDWQEVAARVTEIAPPIRIPIAAAVLRRATQATGVWGKMVLASERDSTPDALREVIITFLDRMRQGDDFNFDDPALKQMAAGLVAAGVVTQQQVDEIDAMANRPQKFSPLECRQAMKGA